MFASKLEDDIIPIRTIWDPSGKHTAGEGQDSSRAAVIQTKEMTAYCWWLCSKALQKSCTTCLA